jgi:hypothetical protein
VSQPGHDTSRVVTGGDLAARLYDVLVNGIPRAVYLHIGPPKTGTTYLQEVLWRNRDRLAASDLTYPGSGPADHFHAALDLRGIAFGGYENPRTVGAWDRLAARARAARTRQVVISHEVLAGADEAQIARVVADFGGSEVHVVYCARDLARQLPALWQESLKNRHTRTYGRFLRRALPEDDRPPTGPWRVQDAVGTLARWSASVPRERIHVVTVPAAGTPRETLWRRFCQVLGISPEGFDLEVGRANRSLGAVDAEMLRQLNSRLPPELPWPAYERIVKARFSRRADAGSSGERLRVPLRYKAAVHVRAERSRAALAEAGYEVVGDLDDLIPADESFGAVARVPAKQVTAAAIDLLVTVLTEERQPQRVRPAEAATTLLRHLRGGRQRGRRNR